MSQRVPFTLGATGRRTFLKSAAAGAAGFLASALAGCRASGGGDAGPAEEADPMAALRKVDPSLVRWQEVRRIELQSEQLPAFAIDESDILLVCGDRRVQCLGPDGREVAVLDPGGEPQCIATSADTVFVGLLDRVVVLGRDGARRAEWGPFGARSHLSAIAATEGLVAVADSGARLVRLLDGKSERTLGAKDETRSYPGIVAPSPHVDVAWSRDGLLLVTNPGRHSIETWTRDGAFRSAWGTASSDLAGFCGCCNPTDIALLADGSVVTAEKGIPRVKVYGADGAFREVVAAPDAFDSATNGLDLAVNRAGEIAVLDERARAVRWFRPREEGAKANG